MADKNDSPGRRIYDRYETNSTAYVRRGLENVETVLMENVSARGAAILGYRPLAVDDKLTVLFRLPFSSKRRIHKQARVVWCAQIKDGVWEAGLDFGMDNTILLS